MLNAVYRLAAPRRFEVAFENVDLSDGSVIVRPEYLSICHADQRYYCGMRDADVLKQKLPMALIHEAVGRVLYDPSGCLTAGQRVVMVPNLPVEDDPYIAENYLRSSVFRSSSADGFMQELVCADSSRIVAVPDTLDNAVASFTELVSVAVHAVGRFLAFAHGRRNVIGVWGDGNVGYIVSLLLSRMLPDSRIVVMGRNEDKLADFTFADQTFLVSGIPDGMKVDHAFECVGGDGAADAIRQIIDLISPEGTLALMGVSEPEVPLNTRMVLEKGLRLFGSSRSGRADFDRVFELYGDYPDIPVYLERIVGDVVAVSDVGDVARAFESDVRRHQGKTIMKWEV